MYHLGFVHPCDEEQQHIEITSIEAKDHKHFAVKSQNPDLPDAKYYAVSFAEVHPTCTCVDWTWTGQLCKHILAAELFQEKGIS